MIVIPAAPGPLAGGHPPPAWDPRPSRPRPVLARAAALVAVAGVLFASVTGARALDSRYTERADTCTTLRLDGLNTLVGAAGTPAPEPGPNGCVFRLDAADGTGRAAGTVHADYHSVATLARLRYEMLLDDVTSSVTDRKGVRAVTGAGRAGFAYVDARPDAPQIIEVTVVVLDSNLVVRARVALVSPQRSWTADQEDRVVDTLTASIRQSLVALAQ